MALATWAAYKSKLEEAPVFPAYIGQAAASATIGNFISTMRIRGFATPGASAVCNKDTAGALFLPRHWSGADVMRLLQARAASPSAFGSLILIDVLVRQGGLSGTVTTEQTTNLPTTALPRYTDGVGVMAAIDIHTTVGTTGTTISARYTNTVPTGSRNTPSVAFGATNFREQDKFIVLPLQSGDLGIQSVEGVTVLATTGTAGAFGITLFKPLAILPYVHPGSNQNEPGSVLNWLNGLPPAALHQDACLAILSTATSISTYQLDLRMGKE